MGLVDETIVGTGGRGGRGGSSVQRGSRGPDRGGGRRRPRPEPDGRRGRRERVVHISGHLELSPVETGRPQ